MQLAILTAMLVVRARSWLFMPGLNNPNALRAIARRKTALFSTNGQSNESRLPDESKIAIIGGGLSGLSVAYHLLKISKSRLRIEIIDKADPGEAGASSVAGGLVHPLSPRGKLVHFGMESMQVTNTILKEALKFQPDALLREEIFRVATDSKQVETLKNTASNVLPDKSDWLEPQELPENCKNVVDGPDSNALGALRLHSDAAKVIHVPTYLKGLWSACEDLSVKGATRHNVRWTTEPEVLDPEFDWAERLKPFDVKIYASGAGLFQINNLLSKESMPVQLVRGQSVELDVESARESLSTQCPAMISGKYLTPLPGRGRVLIGATHEFQEEPWDLSKVQSDLHERTRAFASNVWENGKADAFTSGVRVQTLRGPQGRLPIVGKLSDNSYVMTGLGSRGLLFHGIYGEALAHEVLFGCPPPGREELNLNWWKDRIER